MKASVSIQVRVPYEDAKALRRAARCLKVRLAAYVRDAAVRMAAEDLARNAEVEPAKA